MMILTVGAHLTDAIMFMPRDTDPHSTSTCEPLRQHTTRHGPMLLSKAWSEAH
jgi:hypothetical protein